MKKETKKEEMKEAKAAEVVQTPVLEAPAASAVAPKSKESEETAIIQPIDEAKIPVEDVKKEVETWKPITELGKKVSSGEITDINRIFDKKLVIKEAQIVDKLVDNLESDLLLIGQSKGKFGGGQRRVFKQTQKKTNEGNKPKFATYAVVGNKNGFVGIGYGKSKETVPAREKSLRNAKLNLMRVRRGCGSWQCGCRTPHSIPYKVEGNCGSCTLTLMPAPKGTGLRVEKECQKILKFAGIKDVWSKCDGQTVSKINLVKACEDALKKLMTTKVDEKYNSNLGLMEGNKVKEK